MAKKADLRATISLDARNFHRTLGDVKRVTANYAQVIGGLAIGGGVFAVREAMQWGEALANINTIARLSPPALKALGAELVGVSREIAVDKIQLAEAAYQALSGGVTRDTLPAFVRLAAQLGKVGRGSTPEAVEAMIRLRRSFPNESDAALAGMAFKTVEKGIVRISDVGHGIGRVTGIAATAGVSAAELMATISATTGKLPAEEAVNATARAIGAVINPGKNLRRALRQIGAASGQAAVAQFGLLGTIERLVGLAGGDAQKLAQMFPEERALRFVQAMDPGTLGEARNILTEMAAAGNMVGDAFDRWRGDNPAFALSGALQDARAAALQIGEALAPTVSQVAEMARHWATSKEAAEGLAASADGLAELVKRVADAGGSMWRALGAFGTWYEDVLERADKSLRVAPGSESARTRFGDVGLRAAPVAVERAAMASLQRRGVDVTRTDPAFFVLLEERVNQIVLELQGSGKSGGLPPRG